MSFDNFISNVRAEVAKRFDLKNDAEIDAFFIGLEESAKDNQEGIEKRDKMLKDTSVNVDDNTVKLRKGVKKFRAENYVIYDIDYLLENLAREIFMLYQAKSDFDKPLLDVDEIRRTFADMFVDYAPCEGCTNPDTYGMICVKCGACGRKFDDKGGLIDDQP